MISSTQLEDLTNRFGDLLMCPGFVGRWGKTSDAWGKLLVPGASSGLREAVKLWQGWDTKSSAQFGWWRGEVEKRAIRPITVSTMSVSAIRIRLRLTRRTIATGKDGLGGTRLSGLE